MRPFSAKPGLVLLSYSSHQSTQEKQQIFKLGSTPKFFLQHSARACKDNAFTMQELLEKMIAFS
jgi:hypothetical protein